MTLRMRALSLLSRGLLGISLLAFALVPQAYAVGQSDTGENGSHVLQPGETNLDLELFYNITKPDIDALNNEQDLALASAGQDISVTMPASAPIVSQPSAALGVGGPYPNGAAPAAPAAADQAQAAAPALPSDPPGVYTVQRGDTLFRIATQYGLPLWALASANNIADPDTIYVGQQLKVNIDPSQVKPLPTVAAPPPPSAPASGPVTQAQAQRAPAAPNNSGKQILVVLHEQMVYVYQDGALLRQFLASTGLPGTPTVQGTFQIYVKYDAQRMVGPGYDLPGVPWVMYFYRGYALHGTYWHNNFGHPMSHGCVNLRTPEAEWLYQWAPVGTTVTVVA